MGNYMGMPSSTQVGFPPSPYPLPVARPPIIPPMRQLDVGLGPPLPFQPGRTPIPLVFSGLAGRPPLVQPNGIMVPSLSQAIPFGVPALAPIDKVIITNEIYNTNRPVNRQVVNGQGQQFPQLVPALQQTIIQTQTVVDPNQSNTYSMIPGTHIVLPGDPFQQGIPNYSVQQQLMQQQMMQQQLAQQQMMQGNLGVPIYDPMYPQGMYPESQTDVFASQGLIPNGSMNSMPSNPLIQGSIVAQPHPMNPTTGEMLQLQMLSQQFGNLNQSQNVRQSMVIDPHLIPGQPPLMFPTSIPNQVQITQIVQRPDLPAFPSPGYARPVQNVPLIPPRTLEIINTLKRSRQFVQDLPHGTPLPPFYILSKQAYYEGQWANGLPGGYARVFYDSDAYFEGYFLNGQAYCKEGIWVYPDGSYYVGGFVNSTPNGFGQLVYRDNGVKYVGSWVDGKPQGQGKEEFKDGSFYQGSFVDGVKQGVGRFVWSDGSFYEGQFRDGFMDGQGVKQFSNGSRFIGEFRRNKIYGKGTFVSQTGQYKGEFIDNKRQGVGTFKYADGRIYVGEFNDDRQNGRGRLLIPNGRLVEGEWRDGKNIVVNNISQSTSINDIDFSLESFDIDRANGTIVQIPNVPITTSLQADRGSQIMMPLEPVHPLGTNGSGIQNAYHYSANYRPTQSSALRSTQVVNFYPATSSPLGSRLWI